MCTGEFNFGNKQVLIFTQCLHAILLAQLVWPPHSLETNKNNTHTHTRKQQLLCFLSSPLTIFHSSYFTALSQPQQQQQEQAQQQQQK